MIIVTLNEDRYAYDIHSLVKAFYPEQEIKVFVKGTKEERSDAGLPAFFVEYYETSICAGIENGEAKTVHLKMPEDRGTVKNDLKQLLYALLSEETGKTLPWGTLTGKRGLRRFLLRNRFPFPRRLNSRSRDFSMHRSEKR